MRTRFNFQLLLLLCVITISLRAQDTTALVQNDTAQRLLMNEQPVFPAVGDIAPPLRVRWLKGEPVQQFEKGHVYVVEFWATWCRPCVAAMPHLSSLANQYKDKVTIIGIDVFESNHPEKVKTFVDSAGRIMDYHVAVEDSNFMQTDWLAATADMGIPRSFVIDTDGKIAWIGHPKLGLAETLQKVVNNTWNPKDALAKWKTERYLDSLNFEIGFTLAGYIHNHGDATDTQMGDSILLMINELVRKEPGLKYKPVIAGSTFNALIKTDLRKAYEYGKEIMTSSDNPDYHIIFNTIRAYENKINLPPEMYQLGIDAYRERIDAWPESADYPEFYHQMADWYWRTNQKSKAITTEQKAIEAVKSRKYFTKHDTVSLAEFQTRLQQYKELSKRKLPAFQSGFQQYKEL